MFINQPKKALSSVFSRLSYQKEEEEQGVPLQLGGKAIRPLVCVPSLVYVCYFPF